MIMKKRICKLHCNTGSSDKVYNISLESVVGNLYVVNAVYGKRLGNLKEVTKTPYPMSLNDALKVFHDLVNSKVDKGYRIISDEEVDATEAVVAEVEKVELTCSDMARQKALERLRNSA
jgi:hypothetical protein